MLFYRGWTGWEWDDRLGIGNPVLHPSIKNYLRSIKEEQAQARVCPKKSMPLFLDKLQRLAEHIMCKLQAPGVSPISLYLLSRDLCFFSVDFFLWRLFFRSRKSSVWGSFVFPSIFRYFI